MSEPPWRTETDSICAHDLEPKCQPFIGTAPLCLGNRSQIEISHSHCLAVCAIFREVVEELRPMGSELDASSIALSVPFLTVPLMMPSVSAFFAMTSWLTAYCLKDRRIDNRAHDWLAPRTYVLPSPFSCRTLCLWVNSHTGQRLPMRWKIAPSHTSQSQQARSEYRLYAAASAGLLSTLTSPEPLARSMSSVSHARLSSRASSSSSVNCNENDG